MLNLMGGQSNTSQGGLIRTERTQIGNNLFVDVVLSRESSLALSSPTMYGGDRCLYRWNASSLRRP